MVLSGCFSLPVINPSVAAAFAPPAISSQLLAPLGEPVETADDANGDTAPVVTAGPVLAESQATETLPSVSAPVPVVSPRKVPTKALATQVPEDSAAASDLNPSPEAGLIVKSSEETALETTPDEQVKTDKKTDVGSQADPVDPVVYQFVSGGWIQQAPVQQVIPQDPGVSETESSADKSETVAQEVPAAFQPAARSGQNVQAVPAKQISRSYGRSAPVVADNAGAAFVSPDVSADADAPAPASTKAQASADAAVSAVASAPVETVSTRRSAPSFPEAKQEKDAVSPLASKSIRGAAREVSDVAANASAGRFVQANPGVVDQAKSASAASTGFEKQNPGDASVRSSAGTVAADVPVLAEAAVAAPTPAVNDTPVKPEQQKAQVQGVPMGVPSSVGEIFAGTQKGTRADSASGGISLIKGKEKTSLVVNDKVLKSAVCEVGTNTANREFSMPDNTPNTTSLADAATVRAAAASGGIQSDTTAKVSADVAPSPVQATRLVHEIRDIADRISSIDRNSVEVRFDFSESDKLSVRVEYKDGTVHTTFRTDSTQVRDAISHEWTTQSVAAENRGYRLADPVFSGSDATTAGGSFAGNGSGHSRSQDQQAASGHAFSQQTGRFSSSGSSSNSAAPARPALRPETARHLHTFA
jgi:hypothetical protein